MSFLSASRLSFLRNFSGIPATKFPYPSVLRKGLLLQPQISHLFPTTDIPLFAPSIVSGPSIHASFYASTILFHIGHIQDASARLHRIAEIPDDAHIHTTNDCDSSTVHPMRAHSRERYREEGHQPLENTMAVSITILLYLERTFQSRTDLTCPEVYLFCSFYLST